MHKSPWNSYGRTPPATSRDPQQPDPTLGAAANVARGREQLARCLQRVLQDYRAGFDGYRRLVDDALRPSAGPESIAERLRRYGGD